jgi:cytochrome c556
MKQMKQKHIWLAIALTAAVPLASLAHEGATGVVKDRMDLMSAMGKELKSVGQKISTNRNLASISDSATKIKAMSENIPKLFPPGSLAKPTDAKPAIWEKWDQFEGHVGDLQKSLDALAAVAPSGDPKQVSDRFKAVDRSCAACHDDFRQKSK